MGCFGFIEILFLSSDANIDPVIGGMRGLEINFYF